MKINNDDFSKSAPLIKEPQSNTPAQILTQARYYMIISTFFLSLMTLTVKILNSQTSNYNVYAFSFIRFLSYTLLAYYLLYTNKQPISLQNIGDIRWFIVRVSSNCLAITFFTLSMKYVKMSTSSCITMIHPLFISILAYYLLNERFSLACLIGSIICFFGTYLITIAEKSGSTTIDPNNDKSSSLIYLGVILAILNSIASAFILLSSKVLLKFMGNVQLNFQNGFFCAAVMFTLSLFLGDLSTYGSLIVWVCGLANGIVSFCCFYYSNKSFELAETGQVSYIIYCGIIFVFIMGYIFFGETFGISDSIGVILIIGTTFTITYKKL